jgi:putative DNA primase/helicase
MTLRIVDTVSQPAATADALANKEKAPQQSALTEAGNALRLIAQHGEEIHYVNEFGNWIIWDGVRWRRDDDGEIMRRAKSTARSVFGEATQVGLGKTEVSDLAAHAKSSESLRGLKAMIELAKSEPGITVTHAMLDTDPMLLGTPTGTIDLRTGESIAPDAAHLITLSVGVAFDPAGMCPIWERVVSEVFAGDLELIGYFQRLCGYSLTGRTDEHIIVFAYGTGANGKSTLLTTMQSVLGDYAKQTPAETLSPKQSESIRNDVARLFGARLVTSVETQDGARIAESLVKQLTGGDRVTARFLHQEYFEFDPQFKIVIATNHKPIIRGDDYGIWRRIHLLPFSVTIPPEERDKALVDKLKGERAGILAWMVRGCLAWQQTGLAPPPAVLEATAAYRDDMDVFGQWLDECCVIATNAVVQSKVAYTSYTKWIAGRGMKPMSQSPFSRKLEDRGYKKVKRSLIFFEGVGLQHVEGDGDALNF